MNIDWLAGRGTTILLLVTIWGIKFTQSGGWGDLWGAITGTMVVK